MSKQTDLPHSDQCEKGLLGSFIHSPDKVYDKCQFRNVTEKWFYHPDHGKFYLALGEMKKHGMFASWQEQKEKHLDYLIPVTQYCLDHAARLNIATSNLSEVVTGFYTTVNTAAGVDHYIDTLQKKWAKRSAQVECMQLSEKIKQSVDLDDLHTAIAGPFSEAKELCSVSEKMDHNKEAIMKLVNSFEADAIHKVEEEYIKTTLPTLNEKAGGLRPGQLIIVHGIPSSGKSTLARNWLRIAAYEQNKKVALFSIEMTHAECLEAFLADMANVDLYSVQRRRLGQGEIKAFMSATEFLHNGTIDIYDAKTMRMTPEGIRAKMRRLVKNKGVKLVVVDYLQLLRMKPGTASRRDLELSAFTADLKQDAIELGITIILVAAENTSGGVRDSGGVEYDGDNIIRMKCQINEDGDVTDTVAVLVKKWRGSSRGYNIPVTLEGKYCRFIEGRTDDKQPTPKKTYQKRY